jgi:hypothetical protein
VQGAERGPPLQFAGGLGLPGAGVHPGPAVHLVGSGPAFQPVVAVAALEAIAASTSYQAIPGPPRPYSTFREALPSRLSFP